jgi:hypothetical protein
MKSFLVWRVLPIIVSVCFLLIIANNVSAQSSVSQDFVIDKTKPYVYLKFDHIGPRQPAQAGEGDDGLWLRVVNNCRTPIVFQSFGIVGNPGVGLMDEVVDVEPMLQITGYSSIEERQDAEREARRKEHLRKFKQGHKPAGYNSEVAGVARVLPGKDILFSVPRNHVDEDWYMRVRFALDLSDSSVSVGPFTYLPFYEWDIPKEFRPTKAPGASH